VYSGLVAILALSMVAGAAGAYTMEFDLDNELNAIVTSGSTSGEAAVPFPLRPGSSLTTQYLPGSTGSAFSTSELSRDGDRFANALVIRPTLGRVSHAEAGVGAAAEQAVATAQALGSSARAFDVTVPLSARAWVEPSAGPDDEGIAGDGSLARDGTPQQAGPTGFLAVEDAALVLAAEAAPRLVAAPEVPREVAGERTNPGTAQSSQAAPVVVGAGLLPVILGAGVMVLIAPLLRRFLNQERVLASTIRQRLLEIVRAEPGLGLSAIAKRAGVIVSHADYHLVALVEFGMIVRVKVGGRTGFFPADGGAQDDRVRRLLQRNPQTRHVMEVLRARPSASVRQVAAACGMSPGGAHWHIRRIKESGLLPEPAPRAASSDLGGSASLVAGENLKPARPMAPQ
jgi:hypothetical protein